MKKYELWAAIKYKYEIKSLFTNKINTRIEGTGAWPHYAYANSLEEAKDMIREQYANPTTRPYIPRRATNIERYVKFLCCSDWDSWSIKKVIENCNGEEFKEYCKQHHLTDIFKELS